MKKLRERVVYFSDRCISRGSSPLLVLLLSMIVGTILLVGVISLSFGEESNLFKMFWVVFLHVLDPGTITATEGRVPYLILMTLATFSGIFIASLFISIITNGLQLKLEKLREGKSKVIEKGHTLILGWDESIYVIIKELIECNKTKRRAVVVILAGTETAELHRKVKEANIRLHNTRLIIRRGSIHSVSDLKMCSINRAKSVIILGDDLSTIKSMLVVSQTEYFKNKGSVVTVLKNESDIEVARSISRENICIIHTREAMTRIIAQTSLQPGLSSIYRELFAFHGNEIYFHSDKRLTGMHFRDVQFAFPESTVLGVRSKYDIALNPEKNFRLKESDEVILITKDNRSAKYRPKERASITIKEEAILEPELRSGSTVNSISCIGYNKTTPAVLKEIDGYIPHGGVVKLLVPDLETKERALSAMPRFSNFRLTIETGKTHERSKIEALIDDETDGVIVFANENEDPDALSMVSLLHIKEIERRAATKYSIVTEIRDPRNAELVDLIQVDDFVISDLVTNRMLTQISANPQLKQIFDQLLTNEGNEIYIKPAKYYIESGSRIDFYTLTEAAGRNGEIALGYIQRRPDEKYKIYLNPEKRKLFTLSRDDSIIVLSRSHLIGGSLRERPKTGAEKEEARAGAEPEPVMG